MRKGFLGACSLVAAPIDTPVIISPMQPLEPPDSFLLSAAEGWLGLGNLAEARAELAQISSVFQNHPDVLDVQWQLFALEQNWSAALETARRVLQLMPDSPAGWLHQAYALRRAPGGGLQAAWAALLPALEKFPDEPTVPYNLACYACQLEQLDEARPLFQRALAVGGREAIKRMALRDPDLQPLWGEIRNC
jgi:tetratricopeptide (TPR) repeat protein